MNLQEATDFAKLREPLPVKVKPKVRTALQVARRVHQLAAEGGFPYTGRTVEQWARKFLSSSEYVLMEIDLNAPASPHKPRNPDRVQHYLKCSKESLDPIVVDLNKCKTGKTLLGYVPDVITIDGKHRIEAMRRMGHTRVLAWVGCKAVKKLKTQKVINAARHHNKKHGVKYDPSTITTAYALHAAVMPSVGIPTVRQDAGEGGSRPKDHMHSGGPGSGRRPGPISRMNIQKPSTNKPVNMDNHKGLTDNGWKHSTNVVDRKGNTVSIYTHRLHTGEIHVRESGRTKSVHAGKACCEACGEVSSKGARSSGSITNDSSENNVEWDPTKAKNYAPGTQPGYTSQFGSPNFQAPGAGSGPRVTNKGASKSEFARTLQSKGKKIAKIFNKKKKS